MLLALLFPLLLVFSGHKPSFASGTHAHHSHIVHRVTRTNARPGEQHVVDEAHVPQSAERAAAIAYTPNQRSHQVSTQIALPATAPKPHFSGAPKLLARGALPSAPLGPALLTRAPRGPPSLV